MKAVSLNPVVQVSSYCWFFRIGDFMVGTHDTDKWCIDLGTRIEYLESEEKCLAIFPILEIDADIFERHLKSAINEFPQYAGADRTFPRMELLKHVFHTSVSGYWPEKALAWLGAAPLLQKELSAELKAFSENKAMPQALRQKSRRMWRSVYLERTNRKQ